MKKIKYLPGEKSLKVPFIIYADLECLLKEKKVKHKPSGYAWCSICLFDEMKKRRCFECLGENTEKYFTFSVLLKKENDNS